MKKVILVLVSISLVAVSYLFGYFHAANDVMALVSTAQAQTSMVTLKLLEKNRIDKAVEINSGMVESYLETMDIVSTNREESYKFPFISLDMRSSYKEEEPLLESMRMKIAKDYLSFSEKVK